MRLKASVFPARTALHKRRFNSGTAIDIQSETKGTDGNTWYQISINGVSGYIRADFVEGGGNNAAAAASSDSQHGSGDHEDDKQHQHHVHERRDVDFRQKTLSVQLHGYSPRLFIHGSSNWARFKNSLAKHSISVCKIGRAHV